MLVSNVNFNVEEPIVLTIDVSKIKDDLRFYKDVNYPNGLFIDQRISPKYIINYENYESYLDIIQRLKNKHFKKQ